MTCIVNRMAISLMIAASLASVLNAQHSRVELQSAREAAAKNPRDVDRLLEWAKAAIAAGEPLEALQAASSARAVAPTDISIVPTLSKAQILSGRLSDALEAIQTLSVDQQVATGLRNSARAIEIYQNIDELYSVAEKSGNAADYQAVADRLREAAELDPTIPSLSRTLGFLFLDKLQQPQNALPWLESAYATTPDDSEIQTLLARTLLEMGKFDRSLQLYRQLAPEQAGNTAFQLNFAAALIGAREWDEAKMLLERVLASDAENERAQHLLADLEKARSASAQNGLPSDSDVVSEEAKRLLQEANQLIAEGDRTRCVSCYHAATERLCQALEIEPNSSTLNQSLGYVLLEKLGQPENAYRRLFLALQLKPTKLDTQKLMALAALRSGRTCEAIQRFRAVLRQDPNDTWMLVNLGRAFAQSRDYATALDIYKVVLARDPANFTARLGKAEIDGWKGLSDRPIDSVKGLVREQPTNPEALNLLGNLYRWDWDLSSAAVAYHRATAADPAETAGQVGLAEIVKTQAYVATTDGYQFQDNFGFRRSFYGGGLRMSLSDRAYLTTGFVLWNYQQGGINLQRTDAAMDLEYHFSRHLQVNAKFLNFDYSNRGADQAGTLAFKYSPLATVDLYASAAWGEPAILTNITIPLFNIRMNNYATGYDVDLTDHLSSQGSLSYANYYDGNERRFGMTQLSFQPNRNKDLFLRAKYEDLSFADQTGLYFSPNRFELLRLITDYSLPVNSNLSIIAQAEAIDALGANWGWGYRLGPSWKRGDRIEMQAAYFTSTIPGASPFSGNGFSYSALLRF